jgi:DNA-binding response OmpR family regulator
MSSTVRRRSKSEALTVLIVDDDVDARRIYSEYLRVKGLTAFSAVDGRGGIEKANDLRPDVIVLDLAMPRVDGWTVLKQLRESSWTSAIPIIVVTANHAVRDEAFQAGCDAYLLKPCPPETLWLQVRALLRLRSDLVAGSGFGMQL